MIKLKKAKIKAPVTEQQPAAGPWLAPPASEEERLVRIEAMGQQIANYIQFIRRAGGLSGSSKEAKEKAVCAFYERMVALERQLGRIHEELQLG
jgi:hypothetical protein